MWLTNSGLEAFEWVVLSIRLWTTLIGGSRLGRCVYEKSWSWSRCCLVFCVVEEASHSITLKSWKTHRWLCPSLEWWGYVHTDERDLEINDMVEKAWRRQVPGSKEGLFTLQTDASIRSLGAVLSQVDGEGKEHPIAYASRKLRPQECNYATIEKECLALVCSLKVFHTYLSSLARLNQMQHVNARLTRPSVTIQPYNFTVMHHQGTVNGNADGLSQELAEFGTLMMEGGNKVTFIVRRRGCGKVNLDFLMLITCN